jgi:glycosyltransferase involved in cell wall biosynthesis
MNIDKPLISIITPSYNAVEYIEDTLTSILSQTYQNWELLIIDDCSSDETVALVKSFVALDKRIMLYELNTNSGAAVARQEGIDFAKGKYIAFCDSDDTWLPAKLERQVEFMEKNKILFSCTAYEQMNQKGIRNGKIFYPKKKADYKLVLRLCPIGNSTVMIETEFIRLVRIPNIKKRNDYLLWLTLLKKTSYAYGLNEILTCYRLRDGSISNNKFSLVSYQWKIYRDFEKLSILYSVLLIINWGLLKIFKIK